MFNQEKLTQIEIQAKDGKPIPEGLSIAERVAFNRFRCLYFLYRNNAVDTQSAKKEKQDIINEYQSFALAEITAYQDTDEINEIRRLLNQNYRAKSKGELIEFVDSVRDIAMRNVF